MSNSKYVFLVLKHFRTSGILLDCFFRYLLYSSEYCLVSIGSRPVKCASDKFHAILGNSQNKVHGDADAFELDSMQNMFFFLWFSLACRWLRKVLYLLRNVGRMFQLIFFKLWYNVQFFFLSSFHLSSCKKKSKKFAYQQVGKKECQLHTRSQ